MSLSESSVSRTSEGRGQHGRALQSLSATPIQQRPTPVVSSSSRLAADDEAKRRARRARRAQNLPRWYPPPCPEPLGPRGSCESGCDGCGGRGAPYAELPVAP